MSTPFLAVDRLAVSFPSESGRVHVVDRVGLSIAARETLALVGESGCGKSISALAIMRLVPRPGRIEPPSRIRFDGRDLLSLPVTDMRSIRGGKIGMIFQEPMTSLNPVTKVGDQVLEAITLHAKVSGEEARRRVLELFAMVGIPNPQMRFDAYPHQLSGGLKQRVMIAMAMAMRPQLLIADEPTTALDATIRAQILELIRNLASSTGAAVLLITHDFGVVNEVADRVAVMYAGQIVEEGTRVELLSRPRHPYTQGLLKSVPKPEARGHRLEEIKGVVPRQGHGPLRPLLSVVESESAPAATRPAPHLGSVVPSRRTGSTAMTVLTGGALLELRDLRTWFPIRTGILKRVAGHVKAVDGVDLTIFPGETLALVGESGCGKTTVGRTILQLVDATGGNVWFDGVNLSLLSKAAFHPYRRKIQIVMQDPGSALDPRSTVRDSIAEGMEAFGIGTTRDEQTERVADLMRKVSLDPATMWRYPHEFSGGQRQRI